MKIFSIYYRILTRYKIFSLISIGGCSISLSVVILLLSFIRAEKQYDRSIPDMDKIYRIIHTQNAVFVPEQVRLKLESDFPQVLAATNVNIRFHQGDISSSIQQIHKIFEENAPGFAFTYEFYDLWLESHYRQEEKRAQSIRLLSIIAVMLSCMGLFGMAEFSTRKRVREIGIRKVNGAGTYNILQLLNVGFLKWVFIGIILGIPMGWYFMNRWLAGFAYRTSLDWWLFALAATASILVAMLTVSWQTWRAARNNPVESLRYE